MTSSFSLAVADEAKLRQSLDQADIITTLLVASHLSGETDLLDEAAPYIKSAWSYLEEIPAELNARIRDRLVETLKRHADAGDDIMRRPPDELLRRLMDVGAGQVVPEDYLPLVVEELRLGEKDTRRLEWRCDPAKLARNRFRVIVVGAGLSGICAAVRLQEAGIPFKILEKNTELGGTWYENDYPDCGVDTVNHIYSFSFNAKADWSKHFSKRDEIFNYIKQTAEKYDVRKHIEFGVEAQSLEWDEKTSLWTVTYRQADGSIISETCNAVLTAVGVLNRPAMPSIPGLETFAGDMFHTAEWRHDVDLKGKRIAMIGTGASGMQAGPAIAPDAESLTIFQRSPHWAGYNPLYHSSVSEGQMWALMNIPMFTEWQRFLLFWASSDGFHQSLKIDPSWSQPDLSLNQENHAMREMLIAYIGKELDGDKELIAKCVPGYPPYGKRMLRDNHWYRTLRRPNVHLVTDAISKIAPDGVVTSDGVLHKADVLILATGFHAGRVLWPMEIRGRDGASLADEWRDDNPRAYLGISVPRFPNLFVALGPNTGLAHGGSMIFHIECQIKYILQAMREMIEGDLDTLEVKQDVHDRYNALVQRECEQMVWSHPGVTSWYKNKKNQVTITSPWRLVDYWKLTEEFKSADYIAA